MQLRKTIATVLGVVLVAGTTMASISKDYSDWGKGPVTRLMTKDEQGAWKKISTDQQAKDFISLFWARRDPTPNTPQNEFKDAFEARVKVADQSYFQGSIRGSMTDRGRVFVLLGPPARRISAGEAPTSNIQTPGAGANLALNERTETWVYEKDRVPQFAGVPSFEVNFRDANSTGTWRLGSTPGLEIDAILQKAVDSYIFSPNLQKAPDWDSIIKTQQEAAAAAAAADAALKMTELKTDAFKQSVTEFKSAAASPYKNIYATAGEFVTTSGTDFVAAQLYFSEGAGLAADQEVTFFGQVLDANGAPAKAFETTDKLKANKHSDLYVDHSLMNLAVGKYTGYFGVALQGRTLGMAKTEFEVEGLAKDTASVSKLILSANIFALTAAQAPTDPFAFGGLKVVPEGDSTFSQDDELWYFFELRNPGIDPTTNAPKVQVGIEVEGQVDGKPKKMRAPLSPVDAQPVKDTPGHFVVGSSIPLAKFATTEFKMKVTIVDSVKTQKYEREAKFTVVKGTAQPAAPAPPKK